MLMSFWCRLMLVCLCSHELFWWTILPKKCPYSDLFWSVFSRIRTEYGEIFVSPNAGNTSQNNSEYGHFLRSARNIYLITLLLTSSLFFIQRKNVFFQKKKFPLSKLCEKWMIPWIYWRLLVNLWSQCLH